MDKEIYKIRAHLGMCISFFRGEGYSSEFTSHMAKIVSELSADPLVEVISVTDKLCEKCPNNMGGGFQGGNPNQGPQNGGGDDTVTDAEFEEVK